MLGTHCVCFNVYKSQRNDGEPTLIHAQRKKERWNDLQIEGMLAESLRKNYQLT